MQGSCQHGRSAMGMLWRPACSSTRNVRCQVRPMPGASGANGVRCTAQPGRFRPAVPYRRAFPNGSRTSSPRGLSGHRAVRRAEAERAPAAACSWRHPSARAFRVRGGFVGEPLPVEALPPRPHWTRERLNRRRAGPAGHALAPTTRRAVARCPCRPRDSDAPQAAQFNSGTSAPWPVARRTRAAFIEPPPQTRLHKLHLFRARSFFVLGFERRVGI